MYSARNSCRRLALLFLKVNDQGAAMALVFFGFYAPPDGLPRYQVHLPASISGVLGILGVWVG